MSHWSSSGRVVALANWSLELPGRARTLLRLRRDVSLLARSELFDRNWYLTHYPDVAAAGMDPVRHYLLHGAHEGRDPGPDFATRFYLTYYRDVNEAGVNPLAHFLRFGRAEGRMAVPPDERMAEWKGGLENPSSLQARPGGRGKYESLWYKAAAATSPGTNFGVAEALARMARTPLPPAIIVTVYDALAATEACLQSLLRNTAGHRRIIVIDDASPNLSIRAMLDRYDGRGDIEVYRNASNLGYTRTVNRGIELAGRADVVFLNSDTQVTPGWLRNLRLAAYSAEHVGTATAFSNNAGAFSVPIAGQSNPLPISADLDEYARAVSQLSHRLYPETPTGNGFCMYVRRDCINATGLLDEETFRAYGEENDFCMRAGKLGWTHVVDDATLIYHTRSASFGDAAVELRKRGVAAVEARYPEYDDRVRSFLRSAPLNAAHERIRAIGAALDRRTRVRPRVAFVLSTSTGGTPQTNEDLMAAIDHAIEPFVLYCDSSVLSLMHFRDGAYISLKRHELREQLRAFPHRNHEYDAVVAAWLVQFGIELVHIRHIARHGLGLVDVAKALGLPVVFSFHDFYTICPSVNLLDERNVYCAGQCTPTNGACRYALWGDRKLPPLKHAAVKDWQRQMGAMLAKCNAFITTSDSTKETFSNAYPFLVERTFSVIPHGRDFASFERAAAPFNGAGTIRILVPGNLSPAKGDAILADLAKQARRNKIELHVMGALSPRLRPPANFVYHGTYRRSDFAGKVSTIRPHLGGIFPIWAETYSHTLTELWAAGLPVVSFDFGAIGERIRRSGAGWLAPEPTAMSILDLIERLRQQPPDYARKLAAVHWWQQTEGRANSCANMGSVYLALYSAHLPGLTAAAGEGSLHARTGASSAKGG